MPVRISSNAPVKKSLASCPINRRLAIRYPGGAALATSDDSLDGILFRQVRVYDISQSGIALILTKPLTRGDKLYIQVTNSILDFSYDLDAEVRHITPFGPGHWIVGFDFRRELTLPELASLL